MKTQNHSERRYWIQEQAPNGRFVDFMGFSIFQTLPEVRLSLDRTRARFPDRIFRLVVKTTVELL